MSRRTLLALSALTALAVCLPAAGRAAAPKVGEVSPILDVKDAAGRRYTTGALRTESRHALLMFWSLRCAPCLREMAHLNTLHAKYGAKGLVVLGVEAARNDYRRIGDILEQLKNIKLEPAYPMVADPQGSLCDSFGVEEVPQTFLIDRRGVVAFHMKDFSGETQLALDEAVASLFVPEQDKTAAKLPVPKTPAPTLTPAAPGGPVPDVEAPSIKEAVKPAQIDQKQEEFEKNRYFGDFYFNRQEYDRAVAAYNRCLELDERNVYVRLKLGEIHARRKEFTRARELWEQILKIEPDNLEASDNIRRLIRGDF